MKNPDDLFKDLNGLCAYCTEEQDMRHHVEQFLQKHPVSALLSIIAKALEREDK